MSLENFDGGDTKKQISNRGENASDKKLLGVMGKINSGEHHIQGKKIQLDQFGQELLDAENHCNQLKAELQQFRKELPQLCKERPGTGDSIASSGRSVITKKDMVPVKDNTEDRAMKTRSYVPPIRQTSQYITTDNTGAAVMTINNILNGITESVNRLSHLHSHFGPDLKPVPVKENIPLQQQPQPLILQEVRNEEKMQTSGEYDIESSSPSVIEEIPVCNPEVEVKPKDSPKRKKAKIIKQRLLSQPPQDSSNVVMQPPKRMVKVTAKRVDKKSQLHTVKTSMILRDSRSTVVSRRRRVGSMQPSVKSIINSRPEPFGSSKGLRNTTAKLVELYHNKAAKISDSDDEEEREKKGKLKTQKIKKTEKEMVPPLEINNNENVKSFKNIKALVEAEKETDYHEPAAPRTQCSVISKSYELPTIASKLKEVAKSYLSAFNFHMIPFCPAASTSPSHNIGINIQQVLNIIKTRQPVCSISPTLAHNIGLAAEKLNSQPLHALVSTLSSRMTYGRSQCPLLRNNLNYQQLQEMAKEIPEEDGGVEEQTAVNGERQDFNTAAIEEPTKDLPESKGQSQLIWSVDPNKQMQCTCVPSQGVGFRQVLQKYSTANATSFTYSDYHNQQAAIPNNTPVSVAVLKPRTNTKVASLKRIQRMKERNWMKPTKTTSVPQNASTLSENERRKKTLKEVLQNLHDEFDCLNRKYEGLSRHITDNKTEANNDALKELEGIEKELTNKEEEINMVVSLYKEVAALKEQVKTLKKRASQSSVALNPKPIPNMNSSQAALHLTKLLRQIQNIQTQCKTRT